ncbi:MAG: hypothetical protein LQ345_007395 [Seirophora villosa]|nr:MAG: hypothetical protein LQ345_007395 [Seirophora villosa]
MSTTKFPTSQPLFGPRGPSFHGKGRLSSLKAQSALESGAYAHLEEAEYNRRIRKEEQKNSEATEPESESRHLPPKCRCKGPRTEDFCPGNLESPTRSTDAAEAGCPSKLTDMVIEEHEPSRRLSDAALHRLWVEESDDEYRLEDLPTDRWMGEFTKYVRRQLRMPMAGSRDHLRSNRHITAAINPHRASRSDRSNVSDRNKKRGRETVEQRVKRSRLSPGVEPVLGADDANGETWLPGSKPRAMSASRQAKKRSREEQDVEANKRRRLSPEIGDEPNGLSALDDRSPSELSVDRSKSDAAHSRDVRQRQRKRRIQEWLSSVASTEPSSALPPEQISTDNREGRAPAERRRSPADSTVTRPSVTQDKVLMKRTYATGKKLRKKPWFERFLEEPRRTRSKGSRNFYELGETGRGLTYELRPSQRSGRSW